MAAVDVVMPAPPPPPPVPVVRISRLALAAADTVVCLWIASLWVLLASVAAALIGRLACGWGCTGAAWTAVLVSVLFVAIVWPLRADVEKIRGALLHRPTKEGTPTFELEIWCLLHPIAGVLRTLVLCFFSNCLPLVAPCGRERRRWNL